MFEYCIIGAGVTGLSFLLLLHEFGVDMRKVCIIDPHFDGGDLARKWTNILSNTPWSKTLGALKETCPRLDLTAFERGSGNSVCTPLIELALLLRTLAAPLLKKIGGGQIQAQATRANFDRVTGKWLIEGPDFRPIQATKLILAIGSEPKGLHLPIPSIPLEIALDSGRLRQYVTPGQRVLLFGTMHSGTLVIRNLVKDCSANVAAFYKDERPFYWDRDGAYDGIKAEAAAIADVIVGEADEAYKKSLQIESVQNTGALVRASLSADWVVYAIGFQPRGVAIQLMVDGVVVSSTSYNGNTGQLLEAPSAWGFGTAYPNRAPDTIHWDVSIAAFLVHIKAQMPALLSYSPPLER